MKIAVGQTTRDGTAQRRQRQTIAREALAHDDAGHEDERLQLAALDRLLTRRVEDADTARLLQRVATRFYAKQTRTRTIINCCNKKANGNTVHNAISSISVHLEVESIIQNTESAH